MRSLFSGAWKRIAAVFLAGLLTILPLVITVAVIVWVARIIQGIIGPGTFVGDRLESLGGQFATNATLAYLLGIVFVLASIFMLGLIVQMGFRRLLQNVVEPIVKRIPLAGSVYGAAKQIVGLLEKKGDADLQGMRVVNCFFGEGKNAGVLALLPTPDRYTIEGRDFHLVYVPTSPLPMTGGLMFLPVEAVHPVAMSVESLMSVYLSMGITGPEFIKTVPSIS